MESDVFTKIIETVETGLEQMNKLDPAAAFMAAISTLTAILGIAAGAKAALKPEQKEHHSSGLSV
jgi:hypothetical protein